MAFDDHYDVIVAGSGAGGMTAALCASQLGLSAVVIEKSNRYGGTSAVSGGGIWIPCNDQMAAVGYQDSEAEALTYLKHLIGNDVPAVKLETYVRNARQMVSHLAQHFDVRFSVVPKYPDYYPDKPGGKAGARSLRFLCIVAAPEGVQAMLAAHPDVPIFTAALDRQLNEHGYILPGLGDAGDRLFGV